MLDFLNETIGADAATYIGTFLAVVGLFIGAKTIVNRSKQVQKVKNGKGIQANGNVTINITKGSEK